MARILILFVIVVAACNAALATTYYVNPNGGHDGYNGTSATVTSSINGPWQTLGRIATTGLQPGDTVYLACGAVWRETLRVTSSGTAQAPITIAGGPGVCSVAPAIDGAIPIPTHAWVQHSGSIYRAKVPADLVSSPYPGPGGPTGWASWSATGDTSMVMDGACPTQPSACLAFTSGTSNSIAISNNFALDGGVDYLASIQLRAVAGAKIKVVVRRGGPTYERLAPDQWVTTNGDWQTVSFAFRAAAAVSNARLDIEVPATRVRVHLRDSHVRFAAVVAGPAFGVFVDGRKVRIAHHPNFGQGGDLNSPYAPNAMAGGKTLVDTSGLQLPAGATLTPGIGVTTRLLDWAIDESTVVEVTGRKLTLAAPTRYNLLAGYGYFLTGALWMLDSPGEWYFDTSASQLYLWMPDGAAPGNRVSHGVLAIGADLKGAQHVVLRDLAIRSAGTAVALNSAKSIQLANLLVTDAVDYGVDAENCAQCQIQSSQIDRTGLDAVSVRGWLGHGFTIENSTITESGIALGSDGWRSLPRRAFAAINVPGQFANVSRNSVNGAAYMGVYTGASSNILENYFGRTCLVLNDCGAIYVGRDAMNARVIGNIVEDSVGNIAGMGNQPQVRTVGIYLDDLNSGSVVTGNTVAGAEYGVQLHNAHGARIEGNLIFGNRRHQIWAHESSQITRGAGDVYGNSIVSNLLVPVASGPAINLFSEVGETDGFATYGTNHYSALISPRVVGETSTAQGASYTLPQWLATGREGAATATNPVGYASFITGASNIVPNGDLQLGHAGWTWWNQTAPLATAAVRSCAIGTCIELQSGATASLIGSPSFSIIAGNWYRVTFDAMAGQAGQAINVVVRRGGGGSAGYEYLMPAAESFAGTTSWRRYSFTFQALKTVTVADPVTQERGARIDFERNQPYSRLSVAHLEMTALTPSAAAMQIKLLINRSRSTVAVNCPSIGVASAACAAFYTMPDDTHVTWPASLAPFSAVPIYSRDTSLIDSDRDGIADQQDFCSNTPAGSAVNARGCPIGQ